MLGRFDEAWPLAEARVEPPARDVRRRLAGGPRLPRRLIATIEGDRERACRHCADTIERASDSSVSVGAAFQTVRARDLCYLGRFDEAERARHRLVGRDSASRRQGAGQALWRPSGAAGLADRGEHHQAEAAGPRGSRGSAETRRTHSISKAGRTHATSPRYSRTRERIAKRHAALEQALDLGTTQEACPCRATRPRLEALEEHSRRTASYEHLVDRRSPSAHSAINHSGIHRSSR